MQPLNRVLACHAFEFYIVSTANTENAVPSKKMNFYAENAVPTTKFNLLQYRWYRNWYRTTAFSVDPF